MATITANTAILAGYAPSSTPNKNVNAVRRSVESSSLPAKKVLQGFAPAALTGSVVTSVRRVVWPMPRLVLLGGVYVVPPSNGSMKFQWG